MCPGFIDCSTPASSSDQTSHEITIDVYEKKLELHVSDEELARRRAEWHYTPPKAPASSPKSSGSGNSKA